MARVLGAGGIFFRSPDPKRLYEWYAKYHGIRGLGNRRFPQIDACQYTYRLERISRDHQVF